MKKFRVDGWNNFCRVFEMPDKYPEGFCINGGKPVEFVMVDWFNPISEIDETPAAPKEVWIKFGLSFKVYEITSEELEDRLKNFILGKRYVKPNKDYLVITKFGASIIISNKCEEL